MTFLKDVTMEAMWMGMDVLLGVLLKPMVIVTQVLLRFVTFVETIRFLDLKLVMTGFKMTE